VTDLPAPDSPTRQHLALGDIEGNPSMAAQVAAARDEFHAEVTHGEKGFGHAGFDHLSFGLSGVAPASRRAG